ncbi:MAG: cysteine peptidase family C39 domain-containing protein, partial [Fischerella sp.]|nr:cysteine peptidase family C39 domain-containing protein [Fischerella sp.]
MPFVFSEQQLVEQQLTTILGEALSQQELENCLAAVEILEPPLAKQFWQATEANVGIYIVIAGKVRLLDRHDNLIATLTVGGSFGEMTLFPTANFQPYAARASDRLKLCYLRGEVLQALMHNSPKLRDRLYRQAELWDLLVGYCQNSPQRQKILPEMLKALSLCERRNLENGCLPVELCQDCQLWLVYRGELLHSHGQRLTSGDIYTPKAQASWQVLKPTTIYCLKTSDWQTALQYWPQLGKFSDSDNRQTLIDESKTPLGGLRIQRPNTYRKIIPFPQPEVATKQSKVKREKPHPYFPSPKVQVGHWWGRLTRHYPFYAQQSASDCGAACLVMIGNYWGKRFSVNRLRDMTNVSRSGASLRAIATAAESLGFATRPVRASFDKLAEQPLPAIAHWEGKHFIVVYEITKKHVIVGDPAIGQRTLTPKEFQKGWTGYALLLQPTALLKDAKEENVGFWKFFELVKPHYWVLLEVFIASVLIQIFGLVTPVFTQLLLDRVLVQRSATTLNAVALGMIIFGLFRVTMSGVRQYLLDHTANRVSIALLVGFIKHTFRLPLSYFESRYVGDIISRIDENQKIQRFLTGQTLSVLLDLLTLAIYLGMMFWYSSRMALFVLFTVPPFFILALASTSILRRISREIFNAGAEENSYLIE